MSSLAFAAADPQHTAAARFSLQARAEPGVLPRVLELFAKRGLVPRRILSTVSDRELMTIDIEIVELADDTVDYIAACMRAITGVEAVLTA
jgi:acetolactate synthase small subunit